MGTKTYNVGLKEPCIHGKLIRTLWGIGMSKKTINIAKDFTDTPGGRFREKSEFSGEEFREDFLIPSFSEGHEEIVIIINGVEGLPTSFIDEAFGGLVRYYNKQTDGFSAREILARLTFVSEEHPYLPEKIKKFILRNDDVQRT
jgi:hypothetical protein